MKNKECLSCINERDLNIIKGEVMKSFGVCVAIVDGPEYKGFCVWKDGTKNISAFIQDVEGDSLNRGSIVLHLLGTDSRDGIPNQKSYKKSKPADKNYVQPQKIGKHYIESSELFASSNFAGLRGVAMGQIDNQFEQFYIDIEDGNLTIRVIADILEDTYTFKQDSIAISQGF